MNCGYSIRAIALPRVPEHFHSWSKASIPRWRYPVYRAPERQSCRFIGKSPRCVSGRRTHFYVKECGSVPCGEILSAGVALGSGRDALGHSHLTHCTSGRISLHLLDCPPSQYDTNLPPNDCAVNTSNCWNCWDQEPKFALSRRRHSRTDLPSSAV